MTSNVTQDQQPPRNVEGGAESPESQQHRDEGDTDDAATATRNEQYHTACFNCRASRQKCDRQKPCSRCIAQRRSCRYPTRSNRGRKQGSTNKPDTVEKLLSRINESAFRDEAIAAIINSSLPSPNFTSSSLTTTSTQKQALQRFPVYGTDCTGAATHPAPVSIHVQAQTLNEVAVEAGGQESLVSPLHIVAAAITANSEPKCDGLGTQMTLQSGRITSMAPIKDRLTKYFASHTAQQRDWEVLATQSVDCPFKLESDTCDPVASRLIDEKDASLYFQLFFKIRNPLVGLLDATLHTPDYVYSASFTLFSVICALGCAISIRPRDRALYPVLVSLAAGNIKWSIAASVKSLEIIQAIINMQYWAPICPRQSDDPYWLNLSHAVQVAREMGINRPTKVAEHVKTTSPNACDDFRERLFRNYERTWLYTFIADKSFGIITGRSHCVTLKEMPTCASEWWKKPMTEPLDRMISGIIEIRGLLLQAHERRRQRESTPTSILNWHSEAYSILTQTRDARCAPDGLPSATFLPILAFYMDHSLLVLNAQALRDVMAADESTTSTAILAISRRTIEVASRALDLVLADRTMSELLLGFHNNQYIMICHAATEILRAIKRGGLTLREISEAADKVIAIPKHLERITQLLPATSTAHLYLDLARFFGCQVDAITTTTNLEAIRETIDQGIFSGDWWRAADAGLPDLATWLDMGYLGSEQPILECNDFQNTYDSGINEFMFS
ncbi:hypothetical protein BGZ61DRAFT_467197 [Ilyonectria robusta]|uniref:uncharacterized protein n=1 Tax=Ilyonectria robusta TaxID=1079257 RepID=UPI001E8EC9A4|nr:uncharacterized protein BGZ61DRAFT_467197 [Ilyonectria robusta]KAH8654921.1 hypothetical protein BGZ61DRAFT_467197 [Ilyonectria robusta]